MGDIKIFRIQEAGVHELEGTSVELEKSLQTLIEGNLESLLGVKFLATEYNRKNSRRAYRHTWA
jgi:hypothetical protein